MKQNKTAIILCSQDAFANGVKPKELQSYLEKKGYSVTKFDTSRLSRIGSNGYKKLLPSLKPKNGLLYIYEVLLVLFGLLGENSTRFGNSHLLHKVIILRGQLLSKTLRRNESYDLLICESNFDQGIMLAKRIAKKQILDLPAPFAEELFYGNLLTSSAYKRFCEMERQTYKAADYLSFHWHTYSDFVKREKYDGNNFIGLTYGTNLKTKSAKYANQPRIIFLGFLKGYWINLPLLSKLCKLYPNLDVYGGPEPPAALGINYKGYAPTTEIVADYQFGLITISDDELRKNSFSSKHLEYISYGLPVLTPAWRRDKLLDSSSIYYTAETFLDDVRKASLKKNWQQLHEAALRDAKKLNWNNALKALDL